MNLSRRLVVLAVLAPVAGCFVPLGGGGSSTPEEPKPQLLTAASLREHLDRARAKGYTPGRIAPDLAKPEDPPKKHIFLSPATANQTGYASMLDAMYWGAKDDRLCFLIEHPVTATVDEMAAKISRWGDDGRPMVLYAVDSLAALDRPATWPPPEGAQRFDHVEFVDYDASNSGRVMFEICAPKPAITPATKYLVVQTHDPHATTNLVRSEYDTPDTVEVKRFSVDSLMLWQITDAPKGAFE